MEDFVPLEPIPGRKAPAQGVKISFDQPTLVFLTVCTKDRKPWLAQPAVQRSLEEIWRAADAWLVGDYLLMPEHLHLFCAPRDMKFTIEKWIAFWKSQFSRRHLGEDWEWQRNGFHHRMRDAREYSEKWHYVHENPIRKNLVTNMDDWKFRGTVHQLTW